MSGVLALALKRMALSHGTVPSAVPVGQTIASGTNGTLGTNGPLGTLGTLSDASLDGDPLDSVAIEERAAPAANSVPLQCQRPSYAIEEAWRQAIKDAGRFLDAWGSDAETMRWTASGCSTAVPETKGDRAGSYGRLRASALTRWASIARASPMGAQFCDRKSEGGSDGKVASARSIRERLETRYQRIVQARQRSPGSKADLSSRLRGWMHVESGSLDQTIELVSLTRPYGGRQWYFLCPRTGRRASVLWKPPGASSFACRQAWGRQVAYRSQFQSPYRRASWGAQDIERRLCKEPNTSTVGDELPPKPKGMHRRTYDKIAKRFEAYKTIIDQDLILALARVMGVKF